MNINQQMDKMLIDAGFCIRYERKTMIDVAHDTATKTMGEPIACLKKMIDVVKSFEKSRMNYHPCLTNRDK